MADKRRAIAMQNKILMVEDNKDIQIFNRKMLIEEGFIVIIAMTLAEAKEKLEEEIPDLIILDIGMPDGSGLDFLQTLRETSLIPVLMLTGFSRSQDVVQGFEMGCDDYLAKPYTFEVLLVRMKYLLKTANRVPEIVSRGSLTMNIFSKQAFINEVDLLLTPKDFALLQILTQNEGQELKFKDIYKKVWGQHSNNDTRALVNGVSRLRKKLVGSGYEIITVYAGGYVFVQQE